MLTFLFVDRAGLLNARSDLVDELSLAALALEIEQLITGSRLGGIHQA